MRTAGSALQDLPRDGTFVPYFREICCSLTVLQVLHLHQEHEWFRTASKNARESPKDAYPGEPFDVAPELLDHHGCIEDNGGSLECLVTVEDSAKCRALHEVKRQAHVAKLGAEAQEVVCRLCPKGYGPPVSIPRSCVSIYR